jgi:spermidine synthase
LLLLAGLPALGSACAAGPQPAGRVAPSPSPPDPREKVVLDTKSRWNRILVVDKGELRSLYFGNSDGDTQSTISLRDARAVPMEYIRHAASALAFGGARGSALVVGLGGASYPMLLRRSFPTMSIDVVELDPQVRQVARDHFGLVEDARLRVHIADGADFLRRTRQRWDIIFLDAYGAGGVPEALATDAFFATLAERLGPGGLAIANITDADPDRELAIISRFAKPFRACVLQRTPSSDNVIVVAAHALPRDLGAALQALDREGHLPFPVAPMAPLYRPCAR